MSETFCFLTSLRDVSKQSNYNEALVLLNQTIRSVLNQSYSKVKLIVVCNQIPDEAIKNEKIIYLVVDTPIPETHNEGLKDKGVKLVMGLKFLQIESPRYVFILDSDDWVHRDLAYHVMRNEYSGCWFVDDGYIVNHTDFLRVKIRGLCRYCGSCYIYDFNKLVSLTGINSLPTDVDCVDIINRLNPYIYIDLLGNHKKQFEYFYKFGVKFKRIPFASVCYVTNTSENMSKKQINGSGFPFTKSFAKDFSIHSYSYQSPGIFCYFRSGAHSLPPLSA